VTVAELIEVLKTMPQHANVELTDTADCTESISTWQWTSSQDGTKYVFLSRDE
jgi:hypothetical protein